MRDTATILKMDGAISEPDGTVHDVFSCRSYLILN